MKWLDICTLINSRGLGVKILFSLTKPFWISGCGAMLRRGRLCRDRWWILNMIAWGEVGVLRRLWGRMVWECEKV